MADETGLDERSKNLRRDILRVLEQARRGHLGAAFSLIEILRVLYDDVLRVDPANPAWPDRDRFILSKGHGCLALYVLLAEKGFFPAEELPRFCSFGAMLGGHPESPKIPGVETSTGSLGHGLSVGVGCALAARLDRKSWRTFVVVGDGESNEGSIWEAALGAGKHRLTSLTVLVDYNRFQSYGPSVDIQDLEPLADKWRAFGFGVREVDGHDVDELRAVLGSLPAEPDRPTAVVCHTVKGKGLRSAENNAVLAPQVADRPGGDPVARHRARHGGVRKAALLGVYELARRDDRVVFIGSDITKQNLEQFEQDYPDRFFMEGIYEAHIIGMAAGLALSGKIPYINTIATFLTRRCYEQIVVDVCLHELPVRLLGSGGGVVYAPLGPTHLATEDIAIMRAIPNMTVVAPCDADEMARLHPRDARLARARCTSASPRAATRSSPPPSTRSRSAARSRCAREPTSCSSRPGSRPRSRSTPPRRSPPTGSRAPSSTCTP